jgi:hypothetical protein
LTIKENREDDLPSIILFLTPRHLLLKVTQPELVAFLPILRLHLTILLSSFLPSTLGWDLVSFHLSWRSGLQCPGFDFLGFASIPILSFLCCFNTGYKLFLILISANY